MDGFYRLLFYALALISVACGPYAIAAATDGRSGKGLVLIVTGMVAGLAALWSSFYIGSEARALAKAQGGPILNDMPGFGQAMLGGFALLYFAATAVIVIVVSSVVKYRRRNAMITLKEMDSR